MTRVEGFRQGLGGGALRSRLGGAPGAHFQDQGLGQAQGGSPLLQVACEAAHVLVREDLREAGSTRSGVGGGDGGRRDAEMIVRRGTSYLGTPSSAPRKKAWTKKCLSCENNILLN